MGRVYTGDARITVSFRMSQSQLNALDALTETYQQGRGELIREAIQIWINKQLIKGETPNAVR